MANLTFYTNPMSRGRVARWMLEEVAQPYDTVLLDYDTSMKAPEYLAINPMGKVPAIRHGETVVTENGAICAYLADAFPDAGLAPRPDSAERGSYFRWLFFTCGPLEQALTNSSVGLDPDTPELRRRFGYGCLADVLSAIEGWLSRNPYAAGPTFSAADVMLGANLGFGLEFGGLEARPVFTDYVGRVSTRPAAVRARAIDDPTFAQGTS